MGRRKDSECNSRILRLSQRSNGLAFSHHHYLSASSFSASPTRLTKRQQHTSVLSQIDGNGPTRPRARISHDGNRVEQEPKRGIPPIKGQSIRSLIPPELAPKISRTETSSTLVLRARRRMSTASISSKSITPSVRSRRIRLGPKPTLTTMPAEIQNIIFQDLPQLDLHSLMRTNSNLIEVAAQYMYKKGIFASTYRYAQFAETVSHNKHYADMVREIDVSCFGRDVVGVPEKEREPIAGWREWKWRNHDFYLVARQQHLLKHPEDLRRHPGPSPYLQQWETCRDIPIGQLCLAIKSCENLRTLNISYLQIGVDFIVEHHKYPPKNWINILYVSNVPKSWTWLPHELRPIYNIYIIDQLRKLKHLETVIATNCTQFSTLMAQELCDNCPTLKRVDFRESGMQKSMPWMVQGTKDELVAIFRKLEESTPRSPDPRRPMMLVTAGNR